MNRASQQWGDCGSTCTPVRLTSGCGGNSEIETLGPLLQGLLHQPQTKNTVKLCPLHRQPLHRHQPMHDVTVVRRFTLPLNRLQLQDPCALQPVICSAASHLQTNTREDDETCSQMVAGCKKKTPKGLQQPRAATHDKQELLQAGERATRRKKCSAMCCCIFTLSTTEQEHLLKTVKQVLPSDEQQD